jgi:hypothetical protein
LANEKLKQMQAELDKYKNQAETHGKTDEATVVKQSSNNNFSIFILFALLVIAVAYFAKSSFA